MSSTEAMFRTIEKLYAINHVLNAMQKKPHTYCGETIYANEGRTLKMIGQNHGISQAELSKKMYRTSGASSLIVGNLVERGLVKREREKGNSRRYVLSLTEKGQAINEAHAAYDEECARRANEVMGLSEEQLNELSETLGTFIDYASEAFSLE